MRGSNMEASHQMNKEAQDAVLLREIHLAKNIQQRLLNGAKPQLLNGAISGISLPARIIGGDYFDFYPLPDGRLRLIIGDVMGKGIPAAMLMILTRGAFRSAAESTTGPGETLTAMNNALYGDLRTLNSFVTVCCADWDPCSGQFIYANGGHNAPILVRTDTAAIELPSLNGIMLGGLPGQAYDEKEIRLKASDLLFFYTDGVVEAQNRASEMYNLDRLLALLRSHAVKPIAEIENTVVRTLEEYTEGLPQRDDITIVMLKMGNNLGEDSSSTAR